MSDFDFRLKIESWVEGIFDVFQTYLRTVLRMYFCPLRMSRELASTEQIPEISSPAAYLVMSYLVMCLLIRNVDYSDRMFLVDLAKSLNAAGVLDAAKTLKVEALVIGIFPAIFLLMFFVIVATAVLRVGGDNLDRSLLRRNYSYALGGLFLMIGAVSAGYQFIVKPVVATVPWLGLPIHSITFLSIIGALVPMFAIQYIGRQLTVKFMVVRLLAIMIPLLGVMAILKLVAGSFYLMDYLRVR